MAFHDRPVDIFSPVWVVRERLLSGLAGLPTLHDVPECEHMYYEFWLEDYYLVILLDICQLSWFTFLILLAGQSSVRGSGSAIWTGLIAGPTGRQGRQQGQAKEVHHLGALHLLLLHQEVCLVVRHHHLEVLHCHLEVHGLGWPCRSNLPALCRQGRDRVWCRHLTEL